MRLTGHHINNWMLFKLHIALGTASKRLKNMIILGRFEIVLQIDYKWGNYLLEFKLSGNKQLYAYLIFDMGCNITLLWYQILI